MGDLESYFLQLTEGRSEAFPFLKEMPPSLVGVEPYSFKQRVLKN